MRRPGFLGTYAGLGFTPETIDALFKASLPGVGKKGKCLSMPRCAAGRSKQCPEGYISIDTTRPCGCPSSICEPTPEKQREMWLDGKLNQILIRDITQLERKRLLSNYKTLEPAMREYLKWLWGEQSTLDPYFRRFLEVKKKESRPSLCTNEYTPYIQAKETFASASKRLNEAYAAARSRPSPTKPPPTPALKPSSFFTGITLIRFGQQQEEQKRMQQSTVKEREAYQKSIDEFAAKAAAYRKCLMRRNPSPIHRMLSRGPGPGPGPDRKAIPTKYLIGAAILAAILLLRK